MLIFSFHIAKTACPNFTKFCVLAVATAQYSSDGNPVVWTMSRFHIMEQMGQNHRRHYISLILQVVLRGAKMLSTIAGLFVIEVKEQNQGQPV